LVQLHAQPSGPRTLRLPPGRWQLSGSPQGLPMQEAPGGGVWVQLPLGSGIGATALDRLPGGAAPSGPVTNPVVLQPRGEGWWLENGLLRVQVGGRGVEQIWGTDGVPRLSAPLDWRRWRDQGEFWDAWDLPSDYRSHPLPLAWDPTPELAEQGPLLVRLVWRGRCGASALRLDVQLRAASPYLECTLQVDWQQRHELLRLELPLAQPAVRFAADTSGGVLERPAQPQTAREQARWEVPVISWVEAGGLAVLLDGPQGVSAEPERLGVSLLRAPTWPDPGADNGLQRLKLALLPCPQGWCAGEVPRQASQFREPLWFRPAGREPAAVSPQGFDLANSAVQLLACQPASGADGLSLSLQNLSPKRQRLHCPRGWLWRRATETPWHDGALQIKPWSVLELRAQPQSS
jgi:alpha-mannosidase